MEIQMNTEDVQQANAAAQEGTELALYAKQIVIKTPEQYEEAADILKEIKGRAKTLEETRKKITKPLLTAKKEVDTLFKAPAESLKQAELSIKRGMVTYTKEAEAKRKELEAKAREIAVSPDASISEVREALVEASTQNNTPKVTGVVVKKVTKFEIIDESKLPRHVLKPDQALIRADVKAGIAVPGVRVWQEDEISARGKS